MSNFTPLVTREYDFDGDRVVVTFSRLSRKAMMTSMPAFLRLQDAGDDKDAKAAAINDVLNDIADSLPSVIKSMDGLNDAEGNAITVEQLINEMYFMKLTAEIAMSVIEESSVPGGKA